jgi:RNA polymerase sigma factor (sigma-70 family)
VSVQHGGGSTEDQRTADALRDSGLHVFAHLYESYAASLFDYCDGLLRDTLAASDAVQDSLVAADAQISGLPEADRLRLLLYSAARRQCLGRLPTARGRISDRTGTTTLEELGAAVPDFEVAGTAGETLLVLKAALGWLSDRDREVLSLAFRHRFDSADLATVLGLPARRAQALVSDASIRFEQSAPVVAALRAAFRDGRPRCSVLAGMAGTRNLASLRLTPQLGKQLARHVPSCPDCALSRGDRAFAAEQISEIPLAVPPGRLRLRITRTALALGSYRRTVAGRGDGQSDKPDKPDRTDRTGRPGKAGQGRPPAQLKPRRGVPKVMAVSSVALAALVVPGALAYRMVSATGASSRPAPAETALASPSPTAASTAVISPQLAAPSILRPHVHRHVIPPLPGTTQLGELPAPLPAGPRSPAKGSHPSSPAPARSGSPSPAPDPTAPAPATPVPTAPAPTAPAPTTPVPTTPAPTSPPPTEPSPAPTEPSPTATEPSPAPTASG